MSMKCLLLATLFVLAPLSGCLSSEEKATSSDEDSKAGLNSLIDMIAEPMGENCAYGGVMIVSGIDLDGDLNLSDGEIDKAFAWVRATGREQNAYDSE